MGLSSFLNMLMTIGPSLPPLRGLASTTRGLHSLTAGGTICFTTSLEVWREEGREGGRGKNGESNGGRNGVRNRGMEGGREINILSLAQETKLAGAYYIQYTTISFV